ncbi:hypothetical protein [Absidia glauca]|uniref:Uncharacterized protein n=1 Tax=Absidia glauca TaxID=4829 RepID=A0A163K762_ABSGL|nr:hypothetical protein [Absidia glauca]
MLSSLAQPIHVYTRPHGQGTVQHLHPESSPCFNLQSRHIGSIETKDTLVRLSFYRSRDCQGAAIHRAIPICPHPNTLMIRARSVRIKQLRPTGLY